MKEMTVAVEVRASNMSVADRAVPPSAPSGAGPHEEHRVRGAAGCRSPGVVLGILSATPSTTR
jgi:hypothetical protein